MYLKFHDTRGKTKDGPFFMGLFKGAIEEFGREYVVHIVTDIASNIVIVGGLIEDEYPTIFGTRYVHCINLLLKDINNIAWVGKSITKEKMLQIFIINHATSIALYRKHSNLQLLQCAETRFASAFIM